MNNKTCKVCGSDFVSVSNRAAYCSEGCQVEAIAPVRDCDQCGEGFRPKTYRNSRGRLYAAKVGPYCSKACTHEAQKDRFTAPCLECGTDVERPQSARQDRVFCSDDCYRAHQAIQPKVCEQCSGEYLPGLGRSEVSRFCSVECRQAAHSRADEHGRLRCYACGEYKEADAFYVHLGRPDGRRGECSNCTIEAANARRALIEASPVDPGRLEFLRLVRQNNECWYCARSLEKVQQVHLDHVHPISRGGTHEITNLQYLCGRCNRQKHDKTHAEFVDWLRARGTEPRHGDRPVHNRHESVRSESLLDFTSVV